MIYQCISYYLVLQYPSTISNINIIYYTNLQSQKEMQDDGIMLNIAINRNSNQNKTKQQNVSNTNMKKTDLKRMKYSQKVRQNSNMRKLSKKGIVDTNKNISLFKNQKMHDSLLNNLQNKINNQKKQRPLKRQKVIQQGNEDVKEPKIQKRRVLKSPSTKTVKYSQNSLALVSTFTPQSKKQVKIPQLLPQQALTQNKLDTNQIQLLQNIAPKLKESLLKSSVQKLTDIQQKSYLPIYQSKMDVVMKAYTGSGKTLAYLIPIMNRIMQEQLVTKRQDGVIVLVVCPTRQLCVQGQKQATRCLKRTPYIVPGSLYGGEQTNHEKARLRKGTNILFCTPGRVLYHLQHTKSFKINNMKMIVFEEADRTLDMGFQETVQQILSIIEDKNGSLNYIQKILVSAHFNTKVSGLLQKLQMNENAKFLGFQSHQNNEGTTSEEQHQEMTLQKLHKTSPKNIIQEINTSKHLKQQYVLLSENQKIPLMLSYISLLKDSGKILIFVSTIDQVQFLDYLLNNLKYRDSNGQPTQTRLMQDGKQLFDVYKIHGDLDQKLRSQTYLNFRSSKRSILISTQVASRGLDFPDLTHIILFDIPPTITDYGNRVGRSARFNQTGVSLLMLHYQESDYAEKIRYYCPNLNHIDKDVIYQGFDKVLKSMNIGQSSQQYLEGLVRSAVKDDDQKYQIARKAYVSMLRAYARLPDKNIFAVKKLNLKLLARTFGLNSGGAQKKYQYNPRAKQSHFQASRKKRKVQDVKKLQYQQYM